MRGHTTDTERYTTVAIALHWAIAAAILFQLIGGLWMVEFAAQNSTLRFSVYQIHKTVGLLILALSLARLAWRIGHRAPAPLAHWSRLEKAASKGVHIAFYVVMIAAPLSGWAMASASPTNIRTFLFLQEWLPFAHLPGFGALELSDREAVEHFLKQAHAALALLMVGLLALHVGGALKHQFRDRDRILDRMSLGGGRVASIRGGRPDKAIRLAAVTLPLLLIGGGVIGGIGTARNGGETASAARFAAAPVQSGAWTVLADDSTLSFSINNNGADVLGSFDNWTAAIAFDPERLDEASATVEIDMASYAIDDAILRTQIAGDDGFAIAGFPAATFTSTDFRADGDGYIMDGVLTLRGISLPVSIAFTFEPDGDVARVIGSAVLDRTDFGIGTAGAPDETWLKNAVTVVIDLTAQRSSS